MDNNLLVEPPLSGAVVGGERKREGVATTVTDIRSVIYRSRPWSGDGVGLAGFYNVQRDMSGAALDRLNQNRHRRKLRHRSVTIIQGRRWGRGRGQTKHHGPPPPIPPSHTPNNRSCARELELDQTLKCVGAAFAGVGAGIGGRKWSCRTGRGRKVGAKVGGADEKGSEKGSEEVVWEEKDKDEGKGKEEAIEEKGNNEKKKKGAEDEGDESKPDLWTVFDLDPPRHHGPDEQK